MTDLATIRSAAASPAFTPECGRLKAMLRELLARVEPTWTELPEQADEPSRAELTAALQAFHGATSYRYATEDLSNAMIQALTRAKEART